MSSIYPTPAHHQSPRFLCSCYHWIREHLVQSHNLSTILQIYDEKEPPLPASTFTISFHFTIFTVIVIHVAKGISSHAVAVLLVCVWNFFSCQWSTLYTFLVVMEKPKGKPDFWLTAFTKKKRSVSITPIVYFFSVNEMNAIFLSQSQFIFQTGLCR